MEDMARLALVEQGVRDIDKFNNILYELLRQINKILANPHDYNLRTIKSECLKNFGNLKEFDEYLHYVGFEAVDGNYVYPSKHTLSNLRVAQAAIERKINYCFGNLDKNKVIVKSTSSFRVVKEQLSPVNVLTTKNPFLLKIQELFNNMLVYEDEELQELALEKVPLVTLQLMAVDRVREQQARIKRGEIKEQDMPFDIALLIELMLWFKHKFFSWVDKPACTSCGGETLANGVTYMTNEVETCRVELYKCEACGGGARFPRHNDVRTLLGTRRGRCGEWANAFALLARALRYDTRYVYDVTDHVWCEVFDYESNSWLHLDPCESKLDCPLMYSHGWGKRLSYVIAVSRDDVQDVTWRYTMKHKEVMSRRSLVSEAELISSILTLRSARQAPLSPLRRQYLAKRAALELVQLLRERAPGEAERGGRVSGAARWRLARGEAAEAAPHCFTLDQPGLYQIRYHPSSDTYSVLLNGAAVRDAARSGWAAGAYCEQNMRRKEEKDWKKVYLAREDGAAPGRIAWRVAGRGVALASLAVAASCDTFHGASVEWTLQFDGEPPRPVHLAAGEVQFSRRFGCAELAARLAGGAGAARWQHAQLFRQDAADVAPALRLTVRALPL